MTAAVALYKSTRVSCFSDGQRVASLSILQYQETVVLCVLLRKLRPSVLSNERVGHALSLRLLNARHPLSPPFIYLLQVRSRGFTVLGDPYMIPGADMFNHDPNKQSVQIGTDGDDHFVMKTVSSKVNAEFLVDDLVFFRRCHWGTFI